MARKKFDELEAEVLRDDEFVRLIEEYVEQKVADEERLRIDDLVSWIRWVGERGDIFSILIQGQSGVGKTTLALQIAARYYRRGKLLGWKRALEHLMFDPIEVVSLIRKNLDLGRQVGLIIFDDAGAWLSKWGVTIDKRIYMEFSNLLRMAVKSIIYTDIFSVAKYVRDTAKLRVIVRKIPRSAYHEYGIRDKEKEWSVARMYITDFSIRGPYYRLLGEIVYPLYLPEKVRRAYNRKRMEYTKRLADRVIKRLKESRSGKKLLKRSPAARELVEEYE